MRRLVFAALLAASCGGGSTDDTLKITAITPGFSPLQGGGHIVIKGQGFLRDGAPPNHVVIGTAEAPLAAAIDDATLEVVTPPALMPGDVPVTVFNQNGQVTQMSMFHYSTPPKITQITPTNVMFNAAMTTITLTGSGFQDEDAGVTTVTVDGVPAVDVKVTSDTQMSFTVFDGSPLQQPEIVVTNTRGTTTKAQAFRYVPSTHPGLILFTKNNTSTWAVFVDPSAPTMPVLIPQPENPDVFHYRAVYFDANGLAFGQRNDNKFGQISFTQKTLIDSTTLNSATNVTTMVPFNNMIFAHSRGNGQFGTFDPTTGIFNPVGTQPVSFACCQRLAVNGTTMFYLENNPGQLSTIDPTTGVKSNTKTLSPAIQIGDMHFLGNTLYAVSANCCTQAQWGQLLTIDTGTGVTSVVQQYVDPKGGGNFNFSAIAVFTP